MPKYRLERRPDSPRWYIVWSEGRRSKRVSTGEEDRGAAERVLAEFILDINRPPQARPEEIGVSSLLAEYYDDHASTLPSHVQAKIATDRLMTFFGASPVSLVTLDAQDRYIAGRRKDGVKNDTITRELMVLRAALNRAVRYGRLEIAPHVKTLPKAPPRERYLTRKEAARLLWACDSLHLRTFVRIGLYTGARHKAILDLTWDRVDFDKRLLWFALPGKTESNKRRAVVPLEGALYTALGRAKKRTRSKYVVNYHGHRVGSVKKAFRLACKAAKLKNVTPHTLRHTAATWAAQAGEDLFRIAGMLGQRVAATTERYAKHQPEYLRSTARAIMRGVRQKRAN